MYGFDLAARTIASATGTLAARSERSISAAVLNSFRIAVSTYPRSSRETVDGGRADSVQFKRFLQGAWPFGLVEAVWAVVALRRWNVRRR